MFRKNLCASAPVTINVSAEHVWSVLIDLDKYGEWNPFTPKMKSDLKVGAPIDIHVRLSESRQTIDRLYTRREWVTAVEKPLKLGWGTTVLFPFLLRAEKQQLITPIDPNSCSFYTTDKFSGLLYPIIAMFFKRRIEQGFDDTAAALKKRCEQLFPTIDRDESQDNEK